EVAVAGRQIHERERGAVDELLGTVRVPAADHHRWSDAEIRERLPARVIVVGIESSSATGGIWTPLLSKAEGNRARNGLFSINGPWRGPCDRKHLHSGPQLWSDLTLYRRKGCIIDPCRSCTEVDVDRIGISYAVFCLKKKNDLHRLRIALIDDDPDLRCLTAGPLHASR